MRSENNSSRFTKALAVSVSTIAALLAVSGATAAPSAPALVRTKCQMCHAPTEDGWTRISEGRRTPEGWDMTVARMMYAHGVKLTAVERQIVVKYLSDTQGLAPEETDGYRYAVERQPSVVEHFANEKVGETCARCHSYARIAIQRRSEADWLRLSNFHVGQFPVIEIQAGGRDRNWWDIASKEIPVILGKELPLKSKAWSEWQARKAVDVSGKWRVSGHRAGVGSYDGQATIKSMGEDKYDISMEMIFEDGHLEKASGVSTVFTGHEWRGSVKQNGLDVRQVFSLAKDGNHLKGRWFLTDTESLGADFAAVRDEGQPEIISVHPSMIKAGGRQQLTINGVGLSGDIQLGGGLSVVKVLSRSGEKVVLEVEATAGAPEGVKSVKIGSASVANGIAVYQKIDYLKVSPGNPMARVGGNGGPRPKVPVQLEAVAYSSGPDGKEGTADDLLLGPVPANWRIANLNKGAVEMEDAKYAGVINQAGLFSPADAGPNKKRKYGTNNAGELKAIATVKDGSREISSSVPLVVTVQRWVDQPIY